MVGIQGWSLLVATRRLAGVAHEIIRGLLAQIQELARNWVVRFAAEKEFLLAKMIF
jgi:hypothetical protein